MQSVIELSNRHPGECFGSTNTYRSACTSAARSAIFH